MPEYYVSIFGHLDPHTRIEIADADFAQLAQGDVGFVPAGETPDDRETNYFVFRCEAADAIDAETRVRAIVDPGSATPESDVRIRVREVERDV